MADLIDRQAAIAAARDWYEGLICGSFKGLEKRLRALPPVQPDYDLSGYSDKLWRAAYERGKAVAEPRWIPVDGKERLPKEGQSVLVTDEDGEIDIAHIIDYSDIGEGIEWWAHDYKCYPIAWSELPTAYERSEDDEG